MASRERVAASDVKIRSENARRRIGPRVKCGAERAPGGAGCRKIPQKLGDVPRPVPELLDNRRQPHNTEDQDRGEQRSPAPLALMPIVAGFTQVRGRLK